MAFSEIVTLLNRTSKEVVGMWDGKPHRIPAGKKVAIPRIAAEAIRRQNPVMGSEDPYTGDMDYLVSILEDGEPETPVEQSDRITRMNRTQIGKNDVIVEGRNGLYSAKDVHQSLPLNSGFVKP